MLFPNDRQKGRGSRGEKRWARTRRIEQGETIIRIYYIIKESIINEKMGGRGMEGETGKLGEQFGDLFD